MINSKYWRKIYFFLLAISFFINFLLADNVPSCFLSHDSIDDEKYTEKHSLYYSDIECSSKDEALVNWKSIAVVNRKNVCLCYYDVRFFDRRNSEKNFQFFVCDAQNIDLDENVLKETIWFFMEVVRDTESEKNSIIEVLEKEIYKRRILLLDSYKYEKQNSSWCFTIKFKDKDSVGEVDLHSVSWREALQKERKLWEKKYEMPSHQQNYVTLKSRVQTFLYKSTGHRQGYESLVHDCSTPEYTEWRVDIPIPYIELAKYGYIFTGPSADNVECAFCGKKYYILDKDDSGLSLQHRLTPLCPYVEKIN